MHCGDGPESGRGRGRTALVATLLVRIGKSHQGRLSERLAHQLNSDRYSARRKASRHGNGWETGDRSEKAVPPDLRLADRHHQNLLVWICNGVEPLIGKYCEHLIL